MKGKRSPTNDSPEEKRHKKKSNLAVYQAELPIVFEDQDSETSSGETTDSDVPQLITVLPQTVLS